VALRDRDGARARAADLIHLSEGVQWLAQLIEHERRPRRPRGAARGGDGRGPS
jgi:hypothetical protein